MPLAATGARARRRDGGRRLGASSSAVWLLAARVWIDWLRRGAAIVADARPRTAGALPLLFAFGLLLYLLSLAVSYLARRVRARARRGAAGAEVQVLAREAELRMLRAQIDPHFLFNSLHSISALTAADPAGARRMCVLLADFLRESLALGARRTGFRSRASWRSRGASSPSSRCGSAIGCGRHRVDAGADACLVPPLLLQPLVENAVTHGIAAHARRRHVPIDARDADRRAVVAVENPVRSGPPRRRRHGRRPGERARAAAALHGDDARLDDARGRAACGGSS